jgi:hypothetical protein
LQKDAKSLTKAAVSKFYDSYGPSVRHIIAYAPSLENYGRILREKLNDLDLDQVAGLAKKAHLLNMDAISHYIFLVSPGKKRSETSTEIITPTVYNLIKATFGDRWNEYSMTCSMRHRIRRAAQDVY